MQQLKCFVYQAGDEIIVKIMKIPVLEKGTLLPRSHKNKDKKNIISERFRNNVYRAKKIVYELVMCNDWGLYGTVTVDEKKWDRNDLETIKRVFTDWLRNTAVRLNCKILRVIVPEQHASGGWHFHFALQGLPMEELQPFTLDQKLPKDIRIKLQLGIEVYNWPVCAKKFGFCQLEPIGGKHRDKKAVANYMRNAIDSRNHKNGAHLYFASNGLKRAELIAQGYACRDLVGAGVFEDGRVKSKKFPLDQKEEALSYVRQITNTVKAGEMPPQGGEHSSGT